MEMRLFQTVALLAVILPLFVIIPANFYQGLPLLENVAVFLFGIGSCILYFMARRGRAYFRVQLVLIVSVLNCVWFLNAASHGSVIFYFFSASVYTMVFFRGKQRLLLLGLLLLNGAMLICAERVVPGWVTHFRSDTDRLIDLVCGFLTSVIACILLVRIILSEYDQEKRSLTELNIELDKRLLEIKALRGILPICAWCKKIRDDEGFWQRLEEYITEHTDAEFTHGMCPECRDAFIKEHKL
jgi:hypothetical protein